MTDDNDHILNSVVLPEDAPAQVRRACGLGPDDELRIMFFGGPGDVVGTYEHWLKGEQEPRTPVIAYSSMFYTLAHKLGARAFVLTEDGSQPAQPSEHVEFLHTPHGRGRRGIGYRVDEARFARAAIHSVAQADPHIIITDGLAPDALLRGLPRKARVILTVHNAYWQMGQRPTGVIARLRQFRKSMALRNVSSAVCTSAECARQLVAMGMSTQSCLVETPQILGRHAVEWDRTGSGGARRLVFLGRIEPTKGIFDLLSAFETLAESCPDLTLDIAGTGSASGALEQAVSSARFRDRVTLHGLLGAEDVHSLLDRSDLLICATQDVEGLALVVVEAAIHGVPSVVSSAVPAREFFPDASRVFPAGSVDGLTECLRQVISDEAGFAAMQDSLMEGNGIFFDRSLSWGSKMYEAILHP